MSKPASGSSEKLLIRVGVGLLVAVLGLFVIQMLLGWIFSLIRMAVLLALLGIVVWFVVIGPPGWGDDD